MADQPTHDDATNEPIPGGEAQQVLPPEAHVRSQIDTEYDASAIQVLEGLEAVRKRPGMYIGSTGERGLHHLVWEIVDNSVDEALAGHADRVDVTILPDNGVRVSDNGRGIPTGRNEQYDMSTVELVLTQLHAGGKFGGGGYKVSGGLHGVGSSVVNALSTRLEVEVRQKGHVYRMEFEGGVPLGPLREEEATDETGTTITFWASPEIFETTTYDYETIRARFQQMAFLNKGLTINLVDERVEEPTETEQAEDLDHVDDDITEVVDPEDGAERVLRRRLPGPPGGDQRGQRGLGAHLVAAVDEAVEHRVADQRRPVRPQRSRWSAPATPTSRACPSRVHSRDRYRRRWTRSSPTAPSACRSAPKPCSRSATQR